MDLAIVIGAAAVLLAAVILGARAWQEEQKRRMKEAEELQRKAKAVANRDDDDIAAARLPDGCRIVNEKGVARELRQDLIGHIMLVGTGTYGQNMLVRTLMYYYLCGLERVVGSIFLVQHGAQEREVFLRNIPDCFHKRVVFGFSNAFTGGFASKPVREVLEKIDRWGQPLTEAANTACYNHQFVSHRPPGQVLFFWSLGGQAPVSLPVIEVIHTQFPEAQIVGFTALPENSRNREKFAQLKGRFEDDDHAVAGWVVTDNLLAGREEADYCISGLLAAMSGAQLYDGESVQLNNVLALTFKETRGSVLAVQYAIRETAAYPWTISLRKGPHHLGYYVHEDDAVNAVLNALRVIEDGKCRVTAAQPIGEPGTSVFDVVMANIGIDPRHERDDLRDVQAKVEAGYRQRLDNLLQTGKRTDNPRFLLGRGDYTMKFGSLPAFIDANRPVCRITALRLATIKDNGNLAIELIKFPDAQQQPALAAVLPATS